MAQVSEFPRTSDEVRCSYHPDTMTRLRCSRCAKPICPRCGVRTQVGLRCPECAGVRGLPTYRTESSTLLKAGAAGLAYALIIGAIFSVIPAWHFYLSLLIGFGTAEIIARLSANKRGVDLQVVAMAAVGIGLLFGRVLLAQRLGISLSAVNSLSGNVADALYLRAIPDLLFAGIAILIAWYRFR